MSFFMDLLREASELDYIGWPPNPQRTRVGATSVIERRRMSQEYNGATASGRGSRRGTGAKLQDLLTTKPRKEGIEHVTTEWKRGLAQPAVVRSRQSSRPHPSRLPARRGLYRTRLRRPAGGGNLQLLERTYQLQYSPSPGGGGGEARGVGSGRIPARVPHHFAR